MSATGAADLHAMLADPRLALSRAKTGGRPVIRTLGADAPRELILAAGAVPVRVTATTGLTTPRADALLGDAAMGRRGKRLLELLLDEAHLDVPVLITHADALQPQIFAALRELGRQAEPVPRHVHFLDLLHQDRDSSRRYNLARLRRLVGWLAETIGVEVTPAALERAAALVAEQRALIDRVDALRFGATPVLSGTDARTLIAAGDVLTIEEHIGILSAALASERQPVAEGTAVFLCGTAPEGLAIHRQIEAAGYRVVGEDPADWYGEAGATVAALADPRHRPTARSIAPAQRAAAIRTAADTRGAELVLHLTIGEDEAAPWDVAAIEASAAGGAAFAAFRIGPDAEGLDEALRSLRSPAHAPPADAKDDTPETRPGTPRTAGGRSRKSLESIASFGAYQRDWFASIRQQAASGAPFAVVNANTPQEILRAMDVPFVVNQWWASIVAAKQQSRRYLGLLADRAYPTDVEAYSAQGLAAAFDDDAAQAPWGGLPTPDFVQAVASSEPTAKIFAEWAAATDAAGFIYERTIDPRADIPTRWWEELPERWDQALEPERIDLLVEELRTVIAAIERTTDRRFSQARFEEVMRLVNEQEDYYRRTRDLIARTVPAPIGAVDSMPATMVPQWHRGTKWARDAAKAFYEEVQARVDAGLAAVPNERVRLMWVGRGLWSDMGFYQRWEESHGAVFVWTMYLALAADGYIRSTEGGRDPMRALAARFLTMGDELRMPSWAGPWHVHEAQTHQVDAAVALQDADPFVVRSLRAAGIPVLELNLDNFAGGGEADAVVSDITAFIEQVATPRADARRSMADATA